MAGFMTVRRALFLMVVLAVAEAATAQPVAIDLGTLGGRDSRAFAVNGKGQVVGWADTATPDVYHAFSWTADGGMVDLGTVGGPGTSNAWAVNNHGQVVGTSTSFGNVGWRAFSWTSVGGIRDLGTFGGSISEARAVNDGGKVVGLSSFPNDQSYHAFSWTARSGMLISARSEAITAPPST